MLDELTKAEYIAIERHRRELSDLCGREVDDEEAAADWLDHYAEEWRRARHLQMMAMQREEILRHKWIESEKHRHDLGTDAVFDWIRRYAADWRRWFEEQVSL